MSEGGRGEVRLGEVKLGEFERVLQGDTAKCRGKLGTQRVVHKDAGLRVQLGKDSLCLLRPLQQNRACRL